MSNVFNDDKFELSLINEYKPNFHRLEKNGKMSKLDYIIFKLERIEKLLFKICPDEKKQKRASIS